VEDGKAYVGSSIIELPNANKDTKTASVFVRPHQFEITRTAKNETSLKAKVDYLNPAGSVVKVDLSTSEGSPIQAEITQEEFAKLGLKKNDSVFVSLRQVTYYEFDI
ncbi:MAG: TOBE-like domain-containing protein, partial [Candidatus Omnitrophica bacterium]|nr:TOBE-like domain-containing protein [Candidatus Omnitrophota bacterium]